MNCKKCNAQIPYKLLINGKMRVLNRVYCLICHPWRSFNNVPRNKSGKICERCNRLVGNVRGRYCASCIAIMHKQKKKRTLVEYKGGKCQVCGYDKCISNLSFHHKNPHEKEMSISTALPSRGMDYLKKEADKCVLLCCRCHGEVHDGLIIFS